MWVTWRHILSDSTAVLFVPVRKSKSHQPRLFWAAVISSCLSLVRTGCFLDLRTFTDVKGQVCCSKLWCFLTLTSVLVTDSAVTETENLTNTNLVSSPASANWGDPAVSCLVWRVKRECGASCDPRPVLSEASGCDFHLLLLLINHTSSSRVQLPPGFLINHLHYETFITSTWQTRTAEDICHPAEPQTAYRFLQFINSLHL